MELIFTLILLIGLGLNSHNLENRQRELSQKLFSNDYITSSLLKESDKTDVIQTKSFESETNEKEQNFVEEVKGKYISIRLVSGNIPESINKVKRKTT